MPLSTDIYQNAGNQSLASGLAGALNQFTEQRSRLSDLARQREQQDLTQGFQNRALQRAEEAIPAQQAALQKQQMEKIGREIDLGIYTRLQSGLPKEEVAKWAEQTGTQNGLKPEQIKAGIAPMMQIQEPEKLLSYYQRSAMPQEYAKAEIEAGFRKQDEGSPVTVMQQGKPVTIMSKSGRVVGEAVPKQDFTLVQVQTPEGVVYKTRQEAAGMAAPTKAPPASKQDVVKDAMESNALLDQAEIAGPLATGSGLGSLRDAAGALVGMSTEGSKAAAKMKVIGASLTAKVPKMGGPQSDKDVLMYKEAAGNMANDKLPWETRLAAVSTIREINNRQLQYAQEGKQQANPAQAYEGDKEARYQAWKASQGR